MLLRQTVTPKLYPEFSRNEMQRYTTSWPEAALESVNHTTTHVLLAWCVSRFCQRRRSETSMMTLSHRSFVRPFVYVVAAWVARQAATSQSVRRRSSAVAAAPSAAGSLRNCAVESPGRCGDNDPPPTAAAACLRSCNICCCCHRRCCPAVARR
jgi:hypothetical protein